MKTLRSYKLVIFFCVIFFWLPVVGQTLPPDFKPSFLKNETVSIPFSEPLNAKLMISANIVGVAYCCINFLTKKEMNNFSMTITLHNATKSDVFFVEMPKDGQTSPEGNLAHSLCGTPEVAAVTIDSKQRVMRLNPGESLSFDAVTQMERNDYYPNTIPKHEEWLALNSTAFNPQCASFLLRSAHFTESRIDEIVSQLNQATSTNTNSDPIDDLIGDLENEFDIDVGNDANESDAIDPKEINKEAAKLVITSEASESEAVSKTNYDLNLCNNLIQENRQIISGFKSYLNSHQSDDWDCTYEQFKSFLNRRQTALENGTLNPDCMEKMKRDWDSYQKESDRILDAQINKLNQELGGILHGVATPVNSNSGFTPIPSTMTTTPTIQTPSIKSNKLGTGKVAPIKKKVNN